MNCYLRSASCHGNVLSCIAGQSATTHESKEMTMSAVVQVLNNSLEAHVLQSDNSSLAKDCRKDIKAANSRLMKLGRKVRCCMQDSNSEIKGLT